MKEFARNLGLDDKNYIEVVGGTKLSGTVSPDGAKNSALIQLAASALVNDSWVTLENIPLISDVKDSLKMLEECGLKTKLVGTKATVSGRVTGHEFSNEYGAKIRASLIFLGSILPRMGEIILPLPGGDKIGDRPIDIHIDVMKAFNINTTIKNGFIHSKAESLPLQGTTIYLRFPSVLATVNAILLSVLAEGKTVLYNVAKEPEIVDCTNLLMKMGANIVGVGTDKITIEGVKELNSANHEVMPDRLETAALIMSIVATGGTGIVENIIPEHNASLFQILMSAGADIEVLSDKVLINASELVNGFTIETRPYPGFATDLQPIITALALICQRESIITDTVFKERFAHVNELRKMGADIIRNQNTITIKPTTKLSGTQVVGNDIRAVVSLINASLLVSGTTQIEGIKHLRRGHANFISKLKSLNACIDYV